MCNLGEVIEEEAMKKGKREGKREGKAENLVKSVESAMKSFHVDLRTACEGIGSSVEEYTQAAALVKIEK